MAFKGIVTTTAIVLLVAFFIFMIFFMKRTSDDVEYPPHINKCPDYWDYNEINNECENTFGMKKEENTDSTSISNLKLEDYGTGKSGKCKKRDWSYENNLTWDGVTNDEKLDCSDY